MRETVAVDRHTKLKSLKSRRAEKARRELELELGGCCQFCGSTNFLEFDFRGVNGEKHHFMPWPERIRWYWRQHLLGFVRLLCRRCHILVTHKENSKSGFSPRFHSRTTTSASKLSDALVASSSQLHFPCRTGVPFASACFPGGVSDAGVGVRVRTSCCHRVSRVFPQLAF